MELDHLLHVLPKIVAQYYTYHIVVLSVTLTSVKGQNCRDCLLYFGQCCKCMCQISPELKRSVQLYFTSMISLKLVDFALTFCCQKC